MTTEQPEADRLDDVFAFIDSQRERFLERLIDYVRLPSVSAHGQGIRDTALYIQEVMTAIGLDTTLIETPGWPMVLGSYDAAPALPTILLYGHYDVQPPDPLDAWISPPFEPTVRAGRLYGRGVGDNKGQHFAHLLAIESFLQCRATLPCNVRVLLEGEEEVGSPHVGAVTARYRDQLMADLVVISDGPVHESGAAQIVFGVRGVLSFELRVRGANRDLHSGNWGGIAPNPLWTLVHLLGTMKNSRGEITIDGFYERVRPLTALEGAALARLPEDVEATKHFLGIRAFDASPAQSLAERLTAWPTFTINGLHGGYGGPGSKTVLPHEAFVKCDMRMVPDQRADEVFAKVAAHVQRHAPDVEVIRQGSQAPARTPLDSPYAAVIRRAIVLAESSPIQSTAALPGSQGREPLLVPSGGGSLPAYVFMRDLGMPLFGVPYANADEDNHAPNENLEVWRFYQGIKTSAAILACLATPRQA